MTLLTRLLNEERRRAEDERDEARAECDRLRERLNYWEATARAIELRAGRELAEAVEKAKEAEFGDDFEAEVLAALARFREASGES